MRTIIAVVVAMVAGVAVAAAAAGAPAAVVRVADRAAGHTVVYAASPGLERGSSLSRRAYEQIAALFKDDRPEPPPVSARSYLVGDVATGEIIAELNADEVVPIASVSKIFTASVAQKVYLPGALATVSRRALAAEGTSGGLVAGERFAIDELLDPLLLESSNDAAEVIVEGYGRDAFIAEMNIFAGDLGLIDTSFADPSGLSARNVSSARDLFAFARYLYRSEPELIARTAPAASEIARRAGNSYHYWRNRNSFATYGDNLYIGGKTGYTPEAAQTMLAFFTIRDGALDERTYAVVVLKSGARNRDVAQLINYATEGRYANRSRAAGKLLGSRARGSDDDIGETTSLLLVGDIMLDRGVAAVIADEGDDFTFPFAYADFLSRADIAFGNLEGPASDRGYDLQNLYSFRMDPRALEAIADAGFDVLSVANNHTGDWGRPAFEDTLARARQLGLAYVGGGVNRDDATLVRTKTVNGTTFGFLAFSDVGPEWLAEPDNTSLILLAGDPTHDDIIARAAEQVDVLTVSYHFGNEYEKEPSARQRELAMRAIDVGANIVVGHHPHVIQPVERYKDGLIAYSLGNFVFDQYFSRDTMRGLVLEVLFEDSRIVRVTPREVELNAKYQPVLVDAFGD